jgi:hypothetical protein
MVLKMKRGYQVMMNRLSYANVMATLAIFVALGGASYAAVALPHNSVGSVQLRSGAVTPSKLGLALGSNSATVEGTKALSAGACTSTGTGPPPPCAPPPTTAVASTTISTRQRATVMVFATGLVSGARLGGPEVGVALSATISHASTAPGPSSFTLAAPGTEQSATFIGTYPNVQAGHHTVSLYARALRGDTALSFIQLTAVALPPSP